MSTIIGWVIRFLGPGLLKSLLDAVPKDSGTLLTTFLLILGAILNLVIQALVGKEITETEITVTTGAIGFAIQQYYQRRATAGVEQKVEKVQSKVETVTRDVAEVQEGVTEAAVVAAEVTERAEAAVEKAEEAVEATAKKVTPIKNKPAGSGKF